MIIPEGSIMMARFPAPMSGWSMIVPMVVDTIVAALARAMPDRVPAGHHGLLGGAVVFFGVHPKTGRRFVVQSIEGGGWGGRPFEDGESGTVSVCQGDVRNGSIEGIELKCPVHGRGPRAAHGFRRRRQISAAGSASTCRSATWSRASGISSWPSAASARPGACGAASRASSAGYLLREPGETEFG